jgi:hypothetical protein
MLIEWLHYEHVEYQAHANSCQRLQTLVLKSTRSLMKFEGPHLDEAFEDLPWKVARLL